ncbi:RDD family protein [Nocardioides sambongensis]|uniref:RDD family protein n=1 Tax=Nocardioides sambongensis TaxID=2589074 RepID=UPI0011262AE3|nr:RDD family protein [Nocardioides sambongensis]
MPDTELPTASWGRRILALVVDWTVSTLAVVAFVGLEEYAEPGSVASAYTLVVYVLESALLTWLVGGSFGKLVTGLRVVPTDGRVRPLNPLKLLLRQVMVALVIPPLVFRPNGRGLHDMVADTVTVTNETFRSLVAAR